MHLILGGTNEHRPVVGPRNTVQERAQGKELMRRRWRLLAWDIPDTQECESSPRIKSRKVELEKHDHDDIVDAIYSRDREERG